MALRQQSLQPRHQLVLHAAATRDALVSALVFAQAFALVGIAPVDPTQASARATGRAPSPRMRGDGQQQAKSTNHQTEVTRQRTTDLQHRQPLASSNQSSTAVSGPPCAEVSPRSVQGPLNRPLRRLLCCGAAVVCTPRSRTRGTMLHHATGTMRQSQCLLSASVNHSTFTCRSRRSC